MAAKWESMFIKNNQKAARSGLGGMAVNWESTYIYMLFQKAAGAGWGDNLDKFENWKQRESNG